MKIGPCSNCGGRNLYRGQRVNAGGGYAPSYLRGLGGMLSVAKWRVVVCRDCGLTRFFAEPEAREKLGESSKWERLHV